MPEPYYDHGGITIYHGDCRDILPHIICDAIVTSPPYNTLDPGAKPSGIHAERARGRNEWMDKADGYFDQMPEAEYQRWQGECLDLFLKSAPCAWINHKTRYRNGEGIHPLSFYKAPLYAEVVWNRRGSMALNCRRFSPSHEYWFCFGRPAYWDNKNNNKMSVWDVSPARDSFGHPCPFPIEMLYPIIGSSVQKDGMVLDPFMGSGTTLRAAKDLGRRAIGIEIEEKYCEIAAKRLQQEVFDWGATNA